jgi:hypothetical protein
MMSKTKLFAGVLLVLAVLFAQVGTALAAPVAQDTTSITGTIQSITTETMNGVTTVVVTLLTAAGQTQTVRLSADTAVSLGLVTVDTTTNVVTPDTTKVGQTVEIDPTTVIPDEQATDEPINPIAAILAKFFGVEPSVVQGYHDDGYGFGVIAQAMWMAKGLSDGSEGTAVDAGLILQAKKTGDYSAFTLPDGTTPTNWGQFKKAMTGKEKNNLGIIVSGHADPTTDETGTQTQQGNGQGNGNGHGKDNNPGKGKDKNKP